MECNSVSKPETNDQIQEIKIQTHNPFNDVKFEQLKNYRNGLYSILGKRANASMDLIDALACQKTAKSVTDLSEQVQFVREYPSIRDAIHYASKHQQVLKEYMGKWGISCMPQILLNNQPYHLYAVDSTPNPHPHAKCLVDRSYIHDASNQVTGKPINIGHVYSAVVGVTEDPSWVSPIRCERVPSSSSSAQFGIKQALEVCRKTLGHSIVLLDSGYNNAPCRAIAKESKSQTIFIVRSACNRKYYIPATHDQYKGSGRRPHYGDVINLYDPCSGAKPDTTVKVRPAGNQGYISVSYWATTYTKIKGMKGYEDPSALVVIFEYREDHSLKHIKPMVLRVFVPNGCQFNCSHGAWLYFFRFSIERYFSVKKKNLLFGKYQSCEVEHQQVFSLMGSLAYQQWYLAKMSETIKWNFKPWMRYPKHNPKGLKLNPSNVQSGFPNVLKVVGTPSVYRPPIHIPEGRSLGETTLKRKPQPIIRKTKGSAPQEITLNQSVSNARSMKSEIRNEAAKVAADVIGKSNANNGFSGLLNNTANKATEVAKHVGNLAVLLFLLTFHASNTIVSQSLDGGYFDQKLISTASEKHLAISNGDINDENSALFVQFTAMGIRAPP